MQIVRIFMLLIMLVSSAASVAAETSIFTVMTYNIRAGLGGAHSERNPIEARDHKQNLKPVVAAIRSTKADVVALQEVAGEAQAREIAAALGMEHVYARHGTKYGKWWGLAILSRHPIAQHRSDPTSSGRGNTRSDLTAEIRVRGRAITFVNIHPDKDLKDGEPIRRTMARIKAIDAPLILLGDFNSPPHAARLAPVKARFADVAEIASTKAAAAARHHPTFMRDGVLVSAARLDYIFMDPKYFEVLDVRLLDRAYWAASDHIGVTAVLSLKER